MALTSRCSSPRSILDPVYQTAQKKLAGSAHGGGGRARPGSGLRRPQGEGAALPSIRYAISITHVLADELTREPLPMKDGFFEIPDKPGLGVSLDEDAIERDRTS